MRKLSIVTLFFLLTLPGCGDSDSAEVTGEPGQDASSIADAAASLEDANATRDDSGTSTPIDDAANIVEDASGPSEDATEPADASAPGEDVTEPVDASAPDEDAIEASDIAGPEEDTSETGDITEPADDAESTADTTDSEEDSAESSDASARAEDSSESTEDTSEQTEDAAEEDTSESEDIIDPGPCPEGSDGAPCDDEDACTMNDACNAGVCSGEPKDIDQDGFVDEACGGLDCNDESELAYPGAIEVCDGIKNNCTPKSTFGEDRWESEDLEVVCAYCSFAIITCEPGTLIDYETMCWPGHEEYSEMCGDGVDNDCDGDADEGCEG